MSRERLVWGSVLLVALALLGVTAAVVAGRARDDHGHMAGSAPGMMGYAARDGVGPVGDLPQARRQAERFADRLDLEVGEVMQFRDGFYAELREADGRPATEILIDARTGAVWFEYGPAMMWNTEYGMAAEQGANDPMMGDRMAGPGGMMGDGPTGGGEPVAPGSTGPEAGIDADQARRIAQRWLDENRDGLRAGEPEAFPGYLTLHTERDGRIAGMLSVNASTGAVWYHWWHGRFVAMDG